MDIVEIQKTFYTPPRLTTVRGWREVAPSGFHFTMKAWQLITHPPSSPTYRRLRVSLQGPKGAYGFFRPTEEVWQAWEQTRRWAEALEADWIIFQCPPSFTPTETHIAHMEAFFRRLERGAWRIGWEPRGAWPQELVQDLCQELNLVHVVDPFVGPSATSNVAYFRLHGIGGYRYRFSSEDLVRLAEWVGAYAESWVLFNNVAMWQDARSFRKLLLSS